jgi:hypothetical protein
MTSPSRKDNFTSTQASSISTRPATPIAKVMNQTMNKLLPEITVTSPKAENNRINYKIIPEIKRIFKEHNLKFKLLLRMKSEF